MRQSNGDKIKSGVLGVVGFILLSGANVKADFIFGQPINLGPTVNTSDYDEGPCVSADGLELYFGSSRPDKYGGADLWVSTRPTQNDPWEEPVNLGPVLNSKESEGGVSISADGLSLYFTRGGYPNRDIYVSMRETKDSPWEEPVGLGPGVNTTSDECMTCISPNGLELFFISGWDIWVTTRPTTEDPWGEPVNLGPVINSEVYDAFPTISADGLSLFFRSDREPGGRLSGDMWVTRRRSIADPWDQPVYVGPIDDSDVEDYSLAFSADGSTLYFDSQARPGGFGGWDLWQVSLNPIVDLNGDGRVDSFEFSKVVNHWGQDEPSCDIGPTPLGDGIVDVQDLIVLSEYIGDVSDPTLIAHWALDEAEGNIAHDSAGQNNAEVIGSAIWQPAGGLIDGALLLDGVNNYLATDKIRDPSEGPMSVFAWIKGGGPGQVIISQTLGANWLMVDVSGGYLMTDLKETGHSARALVSETVITDSNWHRVGLVWDGANRSLYVDDILAATDTQTELVGSDGGLNIGCDKNATPGTFWSGMIDDVRIYNRTVSP